MNKDFKDKIAKIIDDRKKTDREAKRIKEEQEAAQKIANENCYAEWDICLKNIILPALNQLTTVLNQQGIKQSFEQFPYGKKDQSGADKYSEVVFTLPVSHYNNISRYIKFTHIIGTKNVRVASNMHDELIQNQLDINIAEMTQVRVEELLEEFIKYAIKI